MTWTLLFVAISGGVFSASSANVTTIPMRDKDACMKAAQAFTDASSGPVGFICLSSETGEIARPTKAVGRS